MLCDVGVCVCVVVDVVGVARVCLSVSLVWCLVLCAVWCLFRVVC